MRQLPRGILVAIEGIDGAGKTTQTAILAQRLAAQGLEVVTTKEPTQGPWGMKIRASATGMRMDPEEELRAFLEDRRQHVGEIVRPALSRGAIVLVDRYYFSNAAYQGVRGFDPLAIIRDNEAFAPRPDLLAVIDVPVELGLSRIKARGDQANQFEQRDALERSALIFQSFGGPGVIHVDGRQSIEEVARNILTHLCEGPLFHALCLKTYKEQCEPEFCSFRTACGFPELGALVATTGPDWLAIVRDDTLTPDEKLWRLVASSRR